MAWSIMTPMFEKQIRVVAGEIPDPGFGDLASTRTFMDLVTNPDSKFQMQIKQIMRCANEIVAGMNPLLWTMNKLNGQPWLAHDGVNFQLSPCGTYFEYMTR